MHKQVLFVLFAVVSFISSFGYGFKSSLPTVPMQCIRTQGLLVPTQFTVRRQTCSHSVLPSRLNAKLEAASKESISDLSLIGDTNVINAAAPPSSLPSSASPEKVKTVKKLLPLGIMLFFMLFSYTILRDTKDVLVVTAPKSGAEIIPFLKTYVNLPVAIGFTLLYSSLSNKFSPDKLFYLIVSSFLAFFGAFAGLICKFLSFCYNYYYL
jgi:hypothetical protein